MAEIKVLARDWDIEIYDAVGEDWLEIGGITSLTFSSDMTEAETTDFDSEGWAEHIPAERTKSLSVEGNYLEDEAGERDQGQEEVEEAAELTGDDGLTPFYLESPNGGIQIAFLASVNMSDIGGDTNDPTSWGFDLIVSGDPHGEKADFSNGFGI